MDDKGGGGLQLSVSCALSTMISQCCTFRRLRCWIQFFVWNADECRVLFASTRWRPLHRTPTNWRIMNHVCPRLVQLSLFFTADMFCYQFSLDVFATSACGKQGTQVVYISSIWDPVSNMDPSCPFWVKTTGRANEEQRAPSQTVRDGIKAPWCFELTCVFSYWGSFKCCFCCGQWVTIVVV